LLPLNKDNSLDSWKCKKNNKIYQGVSNNKVWVNGNCNQCNLDWQWKQADKIILITLNIRQLNNHLLDCKRSHSSRIVAVKGNSKQASIQLKKWHSCRHLKQLVIQEFHAGTAEESSMRLLQRDTFQYVPIEWSNNNLSNSKDDLYC